MTTRSTTSNPPTKPSKTRTLPLTSPIEPLSTDTARLYTHIHPIFVLSTYYVQFHSIVADPVPALITALIPLVAFQAAYLVLCLPATGTQQATSGGNAPASNKPGARRRNNNASSGKGDVGWARRISPAILALTLALVLGTPALAVLLVLHGAPLTTHHAHTGLLAAHLALLAGPALVHTRGLGGETWRQIAGLLVPVDETLGAALGTLLGAWLGAVPIPLDWDREWQKWPVTVVTGAYIGYAVGKVAGGTIFKGKTIKFDA